jgi:hypothetical protein
MKALTTMDQLNMESVTKVLQNLMKIHTLEMNIQIRNKLEEEKLDP